MSDENNHYLEKSTITIIRDSYLKSANYSKKLHERLEFFYTTLINNEDKIEKTDKKKYDYFVISLENCIEYRKKSFQIKNLVTNINTTIIYIILWLNSTKGYDFDIKLYARQKSLESDLTKLLIKAVVNDQIYNIRDRFGTRGIILNDNIEDIYTLFEKINDILIKNNSATKSEFIKWYLSTPLINPLDKTIVNAIFNIPFSLDYEKDYIKETKTNGYQALQFTIGIRMNSETLPGCQFEIQLQTQNMHEVATTGTAAHPQYKKKQIPDEIKNIFLLEEELDTLSGIKEPLRFFPRTISGTTIQ